MMKKHYWYMYLGFFLVSIILVGHTFAVEIEDPKEAMIEDSSTDESEEDQSADEMDSESNNWQETFNQPMMKRTETFLKSGFSQRKNPFAASLLSMMFLGGGQFYNGEYTKGTIFLISDIALKVGLIVSLATIPDKYLITDTKPLTFIDLEGQDKAILFSVAALYAGLYIFNIFDAYYSAKEHNKKFYMIPSLQVSQADRTIGWMYSIGLRF